MSKDLETIADYYKERSSNSLSQHYAFNIREYKTGTSHFNINMRKYCSFTTPYNRRDFYKVGLIIGKGTLHYGSHAINIDRPALFLPCPTTPYSWTCIEKKQEGFFCLFNYEFFTENRSLESFKKTSLFKEWGKPLFFLSPEELTLAHTYFQQMYTMAQSDYPLKYEVIRNLLALLLHQALQLKVEDIALEDQNASMRLFRLFDQLLNKQFPLDSPAYPLAMRRPIDYANKLNVHVNHLNSSIKSATGKTTSQHLVDRLLLEAKNLLINTDWDIAQVGYTLGFDQPSHFTHFFKKHVQITPLHFRNHL